MQLIIWDAASLERVASQGELWVFSIAWSPDGDQLASTGNGVYDNRTIDGQVFILEAPPDL